MRLTRDLLEQLADRVEKKRLTNPSKNYGDDVRFVVGEKSLPDKDSYYRAELEVAEILHSRRHSLIACRED